MTPNMTNANKCFSVIAISLVIILSGCEEAKEVAKDAQEQAGEIAKQAKEAAGETQEQAGGFGEWAEEVAKDAQEQAGEIAAEAEILGKEAQEQAGEYADVVIDTANREWNKGMTLQEPVDSGTVGPDGKPSIELCEISNAGLTDFVGGSATALGLMPLIAGNSVQMIVYVGIGVAVKVTPALDPTLTSAAVTVAVMYGAMKVYCAKDEIMENQTIQDFIALVNDFAEKGEEAARIAYEKVNSLDAEE